MGLPRPRAAGAGKDYLDTFLRKRASRRNPLQSKFARRRPSASKVAARLEALFKSCEEAGGSDASVRVKGRRSLASGPAWARPAWPRWKSSGARLRGRCRFAGGARVPASRRRGHSRKLSCGAAGVVTPAVASSLVCVAYVALNFCLGAADLSWALSQGIAPCCCLALWACGWHCDLVCRALSAWFSFWCCLAFAPAWCSLLCGVAGACWSTFGGKKRAASGFPGDGWARSQVRRLVESGYQAGEIVERLGATCGDVVGHLRAIEMGSLRSAFGRGASRYGAALAADKTSIIDLATQPGASGSGAGAAAVLPVVDLTCDAGEVAAAAAEKPGPAGAEVGGGCLGLSASPVSCVSDVETLSSVSDIRPGSSRGGRSARGPAYLVQVLRGNGLSDAEVREELLRRGFAPPRVSQLVPAARASAKSVSSAGGGGSPGLAVGSGAGAAAGGDSFFVPAQPAEDDPRVAWERRVLAEALGVRRSLEVRKVAPDGNCLFHAACFHFDSDGGRGHAHWRKVAVENVLAYTHSFLDFAMALDMPRLDTSGNEAEVLGRWRGRMAMDEEWGDNLAIAALANATCRPAVVWSLGPGRVLCEPRAVLPIGGVFLGAEPFHLLYNGRTHYDAVLRVSSSVCAGAGSAALRGAPLELPAARASPAPTEMDSSESGGEGLLSEASLGASASLRSPALSQNEQEEVLLAVLSGEAEVARSAARLRCERAQLQRWAWEGRRAVDTAEASGRQEEATMAAIDQFVQFLAEQRAGVPQDVRGALLLLLRGRLRPASLLAAHGVAEAKVLENWKARASNMLRGVADGPEWEKAALAHIDKFLVKQRKDQSPDDLREALLMVLQKRLRHEAVAARHGVRGVSWKHWKQRAFKALRGLDPEADSEAWGEVARARVEALLGLLQRRDVPEDAREALWMLLEGRLGLAAVASRHNVGGVRALKHWVQAASELLHGVEAGRRAELARAHIDGLVSGKLPPGFGVRRNRQHGYHPASARASWEEERGNSFAACEPGPVVLPAPLCVGQLGWFLEWLAWASWSFCPSCGLRRLKALSRLGTAFRVRQPCPRGCDESPGSSVPLEADESLLRRRVYATPDAGDFPAVLRCLTEAEQRSLAVVDLHVEWESRRGGKASVSSKLKKSVVRASWRPYDVWAKMSPRARAACEWLQARNGVYKKYWREHGALLVDAGYRQPHYPTIPTAQLLLQSPGLEVAARPWLYPAEEYGDTDVAVRARDRNLVPARALPSIKTSWMRKALSRCKSYARDVALQFYLHDVALAKKLSAIVAVAESQQIAPDEAASDMQIFSAHWHHETEKLEDVCRQLGGFPNLFATVGPAEWSFPLHAAVFADDAERAESPSGNQAVLTLHIYNALKAFFEDLFSDSGQLAELGIAKVDEWVLRFEFQKRGTVHVHVLAWVLYLEGRSGAELNGRSGEEHDSPLVELLERWFSSSADVQASVGSACLLRYVAGYVSKSHDSLNFSRDAKEHGGSGDKRSRWLQVFRMLRKRCLMWQEISLDMAGLPLLRASFTGERVYAPIPGSAAQNRSRFTYQAFLDAKAESSRCMSYIQWVRKYRCEFAAGDDSGRSCRVKLRNVAGPGRNKRCAVAMRLPFELLDIFAGAFASAFFLYDAEEELIASEPERWPDGTRHLMGVLQFICRAFEPGACQRRCSWLLRLEEEARDPAFLGALRLDNDRQMAANVGRVAVDPTDVLTAAHFFSWLAAADLRMRGVEEDRVVTFLHRIEACALLLVDIDRAPLDVSAPLWSARSTHELPHRDWSPEQQAVLKAVEEGTTVAGAEDLGPAVARGVHVSGGPGSGKTEVVLAAAIAAAQKGCRVLIAGPLGVLVAAYRQRLPPMLDIVVETIHSSFRIGRKADEEYYPPGRLRHFDLIILDEVSQIDSGVAEKLEVALDELSPTPFVVWAGDFQQLQPVSGGPLLQRLIEGATTQGMGHIRLRQHELARSVDRGLLRFLELCRFQQPSRADLNDFFSGRLVSRDPDEAVAFFAELELRRGARFTILTVTNEAAAAYNLARVRLAFPGAASELEQEGLPGDPQSGGGPMVFREGMRVRLTLNMDKARGFVNGCIGHVVRVLRRDVFVLRTVGNVLLLVHPVRRKGVVFMPCCYAYATTIRRAQGSTLEGVGLAFDRKRCDRGHGYVGASRAREAANLFLLGRVRRTDWRPVGPGAEGEQEVPSAMSWSTDEEEAAEQDRRWQEGGEGTSSSEEDPYAAADRASEASSEGDFEPEERGFFGCFGEAVESDFEEGGGCVEADSACILRLGGLE